MKVNALIGMIVLLLFLVGCNNADLPPEPSDPGTTDDLAGQAYHPGDPVPEYFAPPWDIFNNNEPVFTVSPEEIDSLDLEQHFSAAVDHPYDDVAYVYRKGFYMTPTKWKAFYFTQDGIRGTGWIPSSATSEFTINTADLDISDGHGYFLSYSCRKRGDSWKCGCKSENDCGYWMVQKVDTKNIVCNLDGTCDPDENVRSCPNDCVCDTIPGDANGNERLDCVDVGIISNYDLYDKYDSCSDINMDGQVTPEDARLVYVEAGCDNMMVDNMRQYDISFTYKESSYNNHISFPIDMEDSDIAKLFGPISDKIVLVTSYDGTTIWPEYGVAQGETTAVNGKGYSVAVTEDFTWKVTGNPLPTDWTLPLHMGWQSIGYPWKEGDSRDSIPISEIEEFQNVPSLNIRYRTPQGVEQNWKSNEASNDFDSLVMGRGYMVHIDCVKGDANENGEADCEDALIVRDYLQGKSLGGYSDLSLICADVNNDYRITEEDYEALKLEISPNYEQTCILSYNISYNEICKYVCPDVNRDGAIDDLDREAIVQYIPGVVSDCPECDLQIDGFINLYDTQCLEQTNQQYLDNLCTETPPIPAMCGDEFCTPGESFQSCPDDCEDGKSYLYFGGYNWYLVAFADEPVGDFGPCDIATQVETNYPGVSVAAMFDWDPVNQNYLNKRDVCDHSFSAGDAVFILFYGQETTPEFQISYESTPVTEKIMPELLTGLNLVGFAGFPDGYTVKDLMDENPLVKRVSKMGPEDWISGNFEIEPGVGYFVVGNEVDGDPFLQQQLSTPTS